ncbi:helix-turn-helix domain-containing protein [Herbiconiux sp. CPCC 205763]|uniref:Helix-turn-helix domain-containing protein n=1 Tax=Herbiconiux aconitum TaxID=2970913 RepID=A0ABT2GU64_9MICO|nr:helix-turn-helix transcriptional regulator [Herbiconiux aconitum]MCS5719758.1 helix-turn-helix domain-containing protein [Herbiconiux aconitum]
MVRAPLTPEQLEAGRRLGETLRRARGARSLNEVAAQAGISPETLRKIETGRLPSPAFGVVAALAGVLSLSLDDLAAEWSGESAHAPATHGVRSA